MGFNSFVDSTFIDENTAAIAEELSFNSFVDSAPIHFSVDSLQYFGFQFFCRFCTICVFIFVSGKIHTFQFFCRFCGIYEGIHEEEEASFNSFVDST